MKVEERRTAAESVTADVDGDAVEPGADVRLRAERAEVSVEAQEDFLSGVLCFVGAAKQSIGDAGDLALVEFE